MIPTRLITNTILAIRGKIILVISLLSFCMCPSDRYYCILITLTLSECHCVSYFLPFESSTRGIWLPVEVRGFITNIVHQFYKILCLALNRHHTQNFVWKQSQIYANRFAIKWALVNVFFYDEKRTSTRKTDTQFFLNVYSYNVYLYNQFILTIVTERTVFVEALSQIELCLHWRCSDKQTEICPPHYRNHNLIWFDVLMSAFFPKQ